MSSKDTLTEAFFRPGFDSVRGPTPEHRRWIRTTLPHARASLTWHVGQTEVTHEAALKDISGGGAAVQMAAGLPSVPGDQPIWLNLIHADIVAEPIEAVLVEARPLERGETLCRLRFISSSALEGVIPLQKERRLWKRFPAIETHAELDWQEDGATHRVAVALVNISGGGAAVRVEAGPPGDRPLWLSLRAGDFQSSRVQCRLVVLSSSFGEQPIARLEFQEACPLDLFEVAVHGLS